MKVWNAGIITVQIARSTDDPDKIPGRPLSLPSNKWEVTVLKNTVTVKIPEVWFEDVGNYSDEIFKRYEWSGFVQELETGGWTIKNLHKTGKGKFIVSLTEGQLGNFVEKFQNFRISIELPTVALFSEIEMTWEWKDNKWLPVDAQKKLEEEIAKFGVIKEIWLL